jgi:hypothetical protein
LARPFVQAMRDYAWQRTPEMIVEHDTAYNVLARIDAALDSHVASEPKA